MWPFRRRDPKAQLLKLKKIRVGGMAFTIKAVNPLLDFPPDKIPQIFTDWVSQRKVEPKILTPDDMRRQQQDMYALVRAGIVDPALAPTGQAGVTVEDLFRDPMIGIRLYYAILDQSLNRFKGLKRLFFSIGLKFSMSILCVGGTVSLLQHTSSPTAA